MSLVNKEEFLNLAHFNNEICVSIFIPTQRSGREVLEEKNSLHLKSQWKEIKTKLTEMGVPKDKIEVIGQPILELVNNKDFWRHQSDGLAVYASEGILKKYSLPINFEPHNFISTQFYLIPLAPVFTGDGRFYLLELQLDKVAFFEASKYSINEKNVEGLTPARLEDRVGYDYEEKHRMHLSQNQRSGDSIQHGYEPATRDRKNEFLRFFRSVDKGLETFLHDAKIPLVVACQDYLFPIYQEANTYKNLYHQCIAGNPSDYGNMQDLHAKAVEQLEPFFSKNRDEKLQQFQEQSRKKVVIAISDVLPSIFEGKVDTLFIENKGDVFGTFDEVNMKVQVEDKQTENNTSLMNLAAIKVIEQGGSVYLLEPTLMPEKESKMSALLRYNY